MAKAYKILGQSAPSAASLTTVYTAPSGTNNVGIVYVCNRSATQTFFRIAIRKSGALINDKHYIAYDCPIDGNVSMNFKNLSFQSSDAVDVYATDATLSFSLFGCEIT